MGFEPRFVRLCFSWIPGTGRHDVALVSNRKDRFDVISVYIPRRTLYFRTERCTIALKYLCDLSLNAERNMQQSTKELLPTFLVSFSVADHDHTRRLGC